MHTCTHELHVAPTQVLHLSQVTGLSPPWAISDAGALMKHTKPQQPHKHSSNSDARKLFIASLELETMCKKPTAAHSACSARKPAEKVY